MAEPAVRIASILHHLIACERLVHHGIHADPGLRQSTGSPGCSFAADDVLASIADLAGLIGLSVCCSGSAS